MVGLTGTALAPRRRHTSRSVIIVGWRGLGEAVIPGTATLTGNSGLFRWVGLDKLKNRGRF